VNDAQISEPQLFDTQFASKILGFVFRGVRRHRVMSFGAFFLVLGLGVALAVLLPRTYHAESRLLANNNELIRALGNPRSALRSEDPTRAARELIFAHENLVSLINQTNLMKNWDETRPVIVKLKDKVVRLFTGPQTEDERVDAMVGLLEKRLLVTTDQQTVTIAIDWPDAQMAYLLVDTAQQNFLETRHITEMTAISEALSILEMHASQLQKTVEDGLHELERVREVRRKGGVSPEAPPPPAAPIEALPQNPIEKVAGPSATEQELAQVKYLLNSKKRALSDLEDFRTRRMTELTAQLQEQKVQYADQHPVVLDTMSRIDALKLDSPQMVQVKADIDGLEQEYRRKGGRDSDALVEPTNKPRAAPRRPTGQAPTAELSLAELSEDPVVDFARNNLRVASAKYEDLLMRIDSARIEQDTARAAFKYRYSVVRPASVPKKAEKPNIPLVLGAAFALAMLAALLAGALRDWSSGRLVEAWQVERSLGLPVLSQVKTP
jgi:uncharacterized protein involved in exopolysaccharide biosynthesis